ncbi:hypothetical protein Y1Q_0017462 [Alligator mississippiensis]|uniref:Secreted protein n=1 Tax=Alligator mississippiensis TaxID=8496 RepID=A0A151P318_ALLMI|nr:hypothetical protein Y1Q_0017462 [Alligator mississippiensis]
MDKRNHHGEKASFLTWFLSVITVSRTFCHPGRPVLEESKHSEHMTGQGCDSSGWYNTSVKCCQLFTEVFKRSQWKV